MAYNYTNKENVKRMLIQCSEVLGHTPTVKELRAYKHEGINGASLCSAIYNVFGMSYNDALAECGLPINRSYKKYTGASASDRDTIKKIVKDYLLANGEFPKLRYLNKNGVVGANSHNFFSYDELLDEVAKECGIEKVTKEDVLKVVEDYRMEHPNERVPRNTLAKSLGIDVTQFNRLLTVGGKVWKY